MNGNYYQKYIMIKKRQQTDTKEPPIEEQPCISAKSWILMDYSTNQYWRGNNTMQKLEIASLTKMYTLQTCLELNNQFNIKPNLCWVQIMQSTDCGTQAGLVIGKYLKIQDIYYGMMLPSGNDAALNLAYYYGYFMGRKDRFPEFQWRNQKNITIEGKKKYNKIYLTRFISYMNQIIKQKLNHSDTHFENPHGLSDKLQKSTAWEIANATMYFLNNPKFSKIVQTLNYTATYSDGETQEWQNTNILLKEGYIGVKTGYTTTAGSCLCSRRVIYHNKKKYDLILVILGCKNQENRFSQTQTLIEDFIKYLNMMIKPTCLMIERNNEKPTTNYTSINLKIESSDIIMGKRQPDTTKLNEKLSQKSAVTNSAEKCDVSVQVKKMIRAYSKKGLSSQLTKQQFIDLINDLMSTIDYPKLNKNEIKIIFNTMDANSDGNISAAELEEVIKQNMIK